MSLNPLLHLEKNRERIFKEIVDSIQGSFDSSSLEDVLSEAMYLETLRLKRSTQGLSLFNRNKKDWQLWRQLRFELVQSAGEVEQDVLLERVISHYLKEIGSSFDPRIYQFATNMIPWGLNWLLNAVSFNHFIPWNMQHSLSSRLHIVGEVDLLKTLAQQGTILLVPTHQSNIDSILVGYVIYLMSLPPFAYGAGLNLFANPLLSFFMSRLGAYTVDRKKSNSIYKETLKHYSIRLLMEGVHSIFFPGGGRSRTGAIESKLKLGLLGTGLDAQIANFQRYQQDRMVYVVPLVLSYHFVLEAGALIEDYLANSGKHRFLMKQDEFWQLPKIIRFFSKLFSSESTITVRVGQPLDVFGNFVDFSGKSIGPNGTHIDPRKWLTTQGELGPLAQRDREYTRELGNRIVERFHQENTVVSSHLVAFVFFDLLRKKYRDYDLFRFLRLSGAQRSLPYSDFLKAAEQYHQVILKKYREQLFFVSHSILMDSVEKWVEDGIRQLGFLHGAAVLQVDRGIITTQDMRLLYYYRNRLTGYGLSFMSRVDESQGFLV